MTSPHDVEVRPAFRCARGVMCSDFRPGESHAHGFTGAPMALDRNHADGCGGHDDLPRRIGASCSCGAATMVFVPPADTDD